ncbi:MAG: hypothetical protein HFF18_12670 [Oscillospiraceae bacterium]|nr:hypothetical protein [Oscillospiraceae bacterium]
MTAHGLLAGGLFLTALLLNGRGACSEKGDHFSFAGGLCWAAGMIFALVEGVGLEELLAVLLALLLVSAAPWKRVGK